MGHATGLAGAMVPGTLTFPLIHTHLLLVFPHPFTPCMQILYPELLPSAPNWAYTWLVVVWNGGGENGPLMPVLNNTTDELLPVFHEYLIFCPPTALLVMSITVPEHASSD